MFPSMADFLARIDAATAGLCIASTLFGVAVGYILSTRISGKQQINTSIKKDCSKVTILFPLGAWLNVLQT